MIRSKLLPICLIAGTLLGACQTTPPAGSAVQRLPLPAPAATQTQEVEWGILSPGGTAVRDGRYPILADV